MDKNNVVRLEARQESTSEENTRERIFKDPALHCQQRAMEASVDQQAALLESLRLSYKSLRLEKAKFLLALLNPLFFQKCLESLEGAQLAVMNYWAFGDGLFFYRHILACQIGKYDEYDILFKDELTQPQLLQIAMKLQASVKWADRELEGERIK